MRLLAILLAFLLPAIAWAAGCDLSQVVGYQLAAGKTIEGYVQDNQVVRGYTGCLPGRVLVFTDHTGVRCASLVLQQATLPKAYLFVRSEGDMKLCVEDELFDVTRAH